MAQREQPIPVFTRFVCPTCGGTAVAQTGTKNLCQSCVNDFLAKNVGLMTPLVEIDHKDIKPEATDGVELPTEGDVK